MKVTRIAGFGPVVADVGVSRSFYGEEMGLPLSDDDAYPRTEEVGGADDFALWLLSSAAQSYFGTPDWPDDSPVPQAWIEFEVPDVAAATSELEAKGYRIYVPVRQASWGQIISRFISPEGLLVELSQAR